ncbi:MAG: rhomboid family intramembrane serine protease, partial [Deltaproteobacteria bacterium]|nr:rhomboid family intramembrane serine protease [Deltaproteobacteria bacterium]
MATAMTDDSETILRMVRDEGLARDWELVLLALGLSPKVHRVQEGIILTVPRGEVDSALAGLAAYEKENLSKAPRVDVPTGSINLLAGTNLGLLLLGFFVLTVMESPALPWFERGSADAARILDGEIWRTVTALTLHGDVVHVVSNAFAVALFFGGAAGQLGIGVAGALVLLAGAGGNLANAFLQGSPHDSVGASTAIFGALGILGSLAVINRRAKGMQRRAWISIAAALALLGMLGAGGGRVDVLAHFLGFLVGSALGILIALVSIRPLSSGIQWTSGSAALT